MTLVNFTDIQEGEYFIAYSNNVNSDVINKIMIVIKMEQVVEKSLGCMEYEIRLLYGLKTLRSPYDMNLQFDVLDDVTNLVNSLDPEFIGYKLSENDVEQHVTMELI